MEIVLRLKFDHPSSPISRDKALSALAQLQNSGDLERYQRALAVAKETADFAHIIRELTAALSIISRPVPANFITAAVYELGIAEASKGAVSMAARDCAISKERRFGAPEIGELLDAAARRQDELRILAQNIDFLAAFIGEMSRSK